MRSTLDDAISRVVAVPDDEVHLFLRDACVRWSRDYADMVAAIGAMEFRGLTEGFPLKQTAQLVKQLTRQSLTDCRALVKVARLTNQRATGGSSIADPELPATSTALAEGALTPGHVREIVKAMEQVPADWPDREGFDHSLATAARSAYPEDVKDLGKRIAELIEQETPPPDDDEEKLAQPVRRLQIVEDLTGRIRLFATLDRETALELQALLTAFGKPRKGAAGEPDTRSKERRQGDVLAEVIHHGATCTGILPNDTRPKVIVTLSWEDLAADVNRILMGGYGVVSPEAARRLACDAQIIPAVLKGKSLPLDIGTKSRTIPVALRRALMIRDVGCAFPGCDRQAHWCEGHHVKFWRFGGKTKLENLVLLCFAHHQIIHHSEWSIEMRGGIPYFIPPAFLDPTRTPIRHARYSMKC